MRLFLLSLVAASAAYAAEPPRGHGPGRGPPAEAKTACAGLSDGAACAFTANGENLTGTCRTGPQGEEAACLPARGGPRHGPPPEATSACSGKTAGAACSFSHHDRQLTGTCDAPPEGETLACRPARPDRPARN